MCMCACWRSNIWGGKPEARRAVKLLTTEGHAGGVSTGERASRRVSDSVTAPGITVSLLVGYLLLPLTQQIIVGRK